MTLDKQELAQVLEAHNKAYEFFLWLNRRFKEGHPPYEGLSEAVNNPDRARQWLASNQNSFPTFLRAQGDELDRFARLFVSFISTSFVLVPGFDRYSHGCGPTCGYCSQWLVGAHLVRRTISGKDRQMAAELKKIYLKALCDELQLELSPKLIGKLTSGGKELGKAVATATYATELIRRSKYKSQGGGNLVLWREIQPKDKRTKEEKLRHYKRNVLEMAPETFLKAEKFLIDQLRP